MDSFRCSIPECDTTRDIYNPQWINNTTPLDQFSKLPKKCERFETIPGSEGCSMSSFDQTSVQKCNGDFIYEDPKEITILNEVTTRLSFFPRIYVFSLPLKLNEFAIKLKTL